MASLIALSVGACSSAPASPNLSTGATTAERQGLFDCQMTRHRMAALAKSMTALPAAAKTQAQAPPPTLVAVWQRATGPRGSGLQAIKQFDAENARYEVLRTSAAENACNVADIDADHAKAVAAMNDYKAGR
jgi:hypothetical protein